MPERAEAVAFIPSDAIPCADAARKSGVSPQTLVSWTKAGLIPTHRAGRNVLIRESDLDRVMRERRIHLRPAVRETLRA